MIEHHDAKFKSLAMPHILGQKTLHEVAKYHYTILHAF